MFQRLAISFALTALFLTSGTGLVGASSSALPGENLYPVKRTWEGLRLFFTFNTEYRKALENTFENERLHEISELLVEGRNETIQFAGVYMEVNGVAYISGIHIVILDTSVLPLEPLTNGAAVVVTGHTNAQGFVDVESIELLPAGSSVPTGVPVEVDSDHDGNGNGIDNVNDNDNHNENSNDNLNSNGNDNFNENENSNDNTNTNINSNDNGNSNGSDDGGSDDGDSNSLDDGSNSNVNDNGGGDTNTNDDSNTGSNDNSNVNGDDSGGGNGNDNSNSNDSHGGGG